MSEVVNSCSPCVSGAGKLCHRVLSLNKGLVLGIIGLQNNIGAFVENNIAMIDRNNRALKIGRYILKCRHLVKTPTFPTVYSVADPSLRMIRQLQASTFTFDLQVSCM